MNRTVSTSHTTSYVLRSAGRRTLVYAAVLAVLVLFLFPFAWMLSMALKPGTEIFAFPPTLIPKHPILSNFAVAIDPTFLRYGVNSLIVAAITTVVIVLLWIFSAYKIYRVVSRLSYLESFLHVCAWCRKIEYQDHWLSLEEHFMHQTGGKASHGICPECSAKMLRAGVAKG